MSGGGVSTFTMVSSWLYDEDDDMGPMAKIALSWYSEKTATAIFFEINEKSESRS